MHKVEFLYNMIMVYDKVNDKVLVQHKINKDAWKGLTFPGGKVEPGESFYQSALRELYEETGLRAKNLDLKGIISWVDVDDYAYRLYGNLYYTDDYQGELEASEEGDLIWMDIEDFRTSDMLTPSMAYMLEIYLDGKQEAHLFYRGNDIVEARIF